MIGLLHEPFEQRSQLPICGSVVDIILVSSSAMGSVTTTNLVSLVDIA